jgi:excisionase family DNA binding protein
MESHSEITVMEAAEILGVGARHVRRYHERGLLVGRQVGQRLLLFQRADVENFVKPKRTGRPKATVKKKGKSNGK